MTQLTQKYTTVDGHTATVLAESLPGRLTLTFQFGTTFAGSVQGKDELALTTDLINLIRHVSPHQHVPNYVIDVLGTCLADIPALFPEEEEEVPTTLESAFDQMIKAFAQPPLPAAYKAPNVADAPAQEDNLQESFSDIEEAFASLGIKAIRIPLDQLPDGLDTFLQGLNEQEDSTPNFFAPLSKKLS